MVSNLNAAASLGKVDPSPLLQHFSTFSPRLYCSVAYWQSCGGGAGIRTQATFLNVGKPKSMMDLRVEFCKVASSHSTHARSQTKTACEGLVCSRRGTKYRSSAVCERSQTKESLLTLSSSGNKSPDEEIRRTEDRWRGNRGRRTRAHPRESMDLDQTRWRKLLQAETMKSRENEGRTCFEESERIIAKRQWRERLL